MDLFDLFAKISLDTSEFDSGLDNASKRFQNVGGVLSSIGGTLTKSVTLPVAGIGTAIIKTGADYEAGMSKVQAISGATGTEMEALGEKAMEMAAKTKFSTSDTAEAYQYMAMAGWDASQMVDGLSGIMNLAAASGENLGTTSDIVTDALTAFGLTAADSGRFADVLAAASNSANTNVSMLGESFKYVAPVAGAMNYSIEDVSVALGLMANSGIKASQAGTSLRTAITNMASPTSNMVAVMNEYGISLTDADGKMLSFSEIMGQLREKMGGLDESTQAAAASTLFGKEAMSGMLAIINAAPEDYNKLTEAINNSSGTTEKMAAVMNDNAAGAFERLKSAVNVLFTTLSESLLPIFTKVVEKITDAVNWFAQLDEGTQNLILTVAGVSAVVGPLLSVIGNIVTAVSTIGSGISALIGVVKGAGAAFSGLFSILMANPIAAVIAAVAALAAGIIALWNTNEDFRNAVGAIWEAIKGFFVGAWEAIKSAWSAAVDFFAGVWQGIQGIFAGVGEFFTGLFQGAAEAVQAAWNGVVNFFATVWQGIQNVFSVVATVLGGFFSAAWNAVQTVWNAAGAFFSGVVSAIKGAFEGIGEFLGNLFSAAWKMVEAAWNVAVDFFSAIGEGIRAAFETVTSFLGEAFTAAWNVITGVWNGAVSFFGGIWEGIKSAAGAAADFIGGAFSKAWSAVTSAWDGATDFFGGVWDGIKDVFGNVWEKFKEIGGNMLKGLWEGVTGAFGWVKEKLGGVVDGIVGVFTGKRGFDTHSPSKVFANIGENLALGLVEGWEDKYAGIKRQIESGLSFKPVPVGLVASGSGYNASRSGQALPQTGFGGRGDTYVTINSPVAVDAIQAAREWKKTTQRMAVGYV